MFKKQEGIQRSKKMQTDQNNVLGKRTDSKPRAEDQANKITKYFEVSNSNANPRVTHKAVAIDPDKLTVEKLEERLREKDKEIAELKEKKQLELQKINYLNYKTKQFKAQSRQVLSKNMLIVAQVNREERQKKDDRLGHFAEGMRVFYQGEKMKNIKKDIEKVENLIKKLHEQSRSSRRKNDEEEHNRVVSATQYYQKELQQLQKEQLYIQKEVAVYKDRLKLAQKQQKSYYFRLNWPIVFDRYQTLQLLGAGGFGQVYRCFDFDTNKIVALKRIYFSGINKQSQKQEFFKHVLRQAEIQTKLDHPNIAKFAGVVQINKQNNLMVFQLEYCGGPQLATYLRKQGCIEESKAKNIIKQLFSALDYLSKLKQRIIHYDLKPSNIMFHEGIVKILDFGLSKIMHGEDTRMDLTSQGVGTYWYLPPETFEDFDPKISAKVDVWSLGVIFFQMLYGRKPFGHGVPQSEIYNKGIILSAHKVVFPNETPRKHRVSDNAKKFIQACLCHEQDERLSPSEAYAHPYLSK